MGHEAPASKWYEPPIRVFVCSEIRLYREGLASALERTKGLELAGMAAGPAECVADVAAWRPEAVLIDAPGEDGELTVKALRAVAPDTRVVVLAAPDSEDEMMALAEAGASAFVTRDETLSDLIETIRALRRGESRCSPRTAGMLMRRVNALATGGARDPYGGLTRRELEIVGLIAEGLSNKQIAVRLQIELPTVKNHVHHILEKLGVDRRAQAVAVMRARGLLPELA